MENLNPIRREVSTSNFFLDLEVHFKIESIFYRFFETSTIQTQKLSLPLMLERLKKRRIKNYLILENFCRLRGQDIDSSYRLTNATHFYFDMLKKYVLEYIEIHSEAKHLLKELNDLQINFGKYFQIISYSQKNIFMQLEEFTEDITRRFQEDENLGRREDILIMPEILNNFLNPYYYAYLPLNYYFRKFLPDSCLDIVLDQEEFFFNRFLKINISFREVVQVFNRVVPNFKNFLKNFLFKIQDFNLQEMKKIDRDYRRFMQIVSGGVLEEVMRPTISWEECLQNLLFQKERYFELLSIENTIYLIDDFEKIQRISQAVDFLYRSLIEINEKCPWTIEENLQKILEEENHNLQVLDKQIKNEDKILKNLRRTKNSFRRRISTFEFNGDLDRENFYQKIRKIQRRKRVSLKRLEVLKETRDLLLTKKISVQNPALNKIKCFIMAAIKKERNYCIRIAENKILNIWEERYPPEIFILKDLVDLLAYCKKMDELLSCSVLLTTGIHLIKNCMKVFKRYSASFRKNFSNWPMQISGAMVSLEEYFKLKTSIVSGAIICPQEEMDKTEETFEGENISNIEIFEESFSIQKDVDIGMSMAMEAVEDKNFEILNRICRIQISIYQWQKRNRALPYERYAASQDFLFYLKNLKRIFLSLEECSKEDFPNIYLIFSKNMCYFIESSYLMLLSTRKYVFIDPDKKILSHDLRKWEAIFFNRSFTESSFFIKNISTLNYDTRFYAERMSLVSKYPEEYSFVREYDFLIRDGDSIEIEFWKNKIRKKYEDLMDHLEGLLQHKRILEEGMIAEEEEEFLLQSFVTKIRVPKNFEEILQQLEVLKDRFLDEGKLYQAIGALKNLQRSIANLNISKNIGEVVLWAHHVQGLFQEILENVCLFVFSQQTGDIYVKTHDLKKLAERLVIRGKVLQIFDNFQGLSKKYRYPHRYDFQEKCSQTLDKITLLSMHPTLDREFEIIGYEDLGYLFKSTDVTVEKIFEDIEKQFFGCMICLTEVLKRFFEEDEDEMVGSCSIY